jgi:hypothetical protein
MEKGLSLVIFVGKQKVQVFRKKRTYSGKFCRKTLKVKVYEKKELSQVNFV